MANGVAHDFNNILSSVIGNIYLSKLRVSQPTELHKHLNRIEEGTKKASELGKRMLEFSDAGLFLNEIINIEDTLIELSLELEQEGYNTFNLDIEDKLPKLVGHEEQFKSMIRDLIINAFESYKDQSGTVLVIVSQCSDCEELCQSPCVCIIIQDYGCGMPEDVRSKMFDPFFTKKFLGRGLGLSTVYGIIHRMGGKIRIHSNINQGTIAKLYFPRVN